MKEGIGVFARYDTILTFCRLEMVGNYIGSFHSSKGTEHHPTYYLSLYFYRNPILININNLIDTRKPKSFTEEKGIRNIWDPDGIDYW